MALKGLEKSLKLDKRKYEIEMERQIAAEVSDIVSAMALEAKSGSYQHGAYLLDRLFGKARQNIGLDGGADGAPVVFMPTSLVAKFGLDKPVEHKEIPEYVEKE